MPELATAIPETLAARDPQQRCILVGGAALYMQCQAAGIDPVPTADVDALGPQDYFDELTVRGPYMPGIAEFRFSRPTGALRLMGATHPIITIKPDSELTPHLLPFSVSTSDGSPDLGGHTYAGLADEPGRLTVVSGITCLNAGDIMVTKAMLGRRKDMAVVRQLVERACDGGLITPRTRARIKHEIVVSAAARRKHHGRYYARVDGS